MSHFRKRLDAYPIAKGARRWFYVPYDQLSDQLDPLAKVPSKKLGIVLIESAKKGSKRPYHKQKLAWVLTSQRHFALEQASRGVAVEYLQGPGSYREQLESVTKRLGPLEMMRPAERELRVELEPLVRDGRLVEHPHSGWLTSVSDFESAMKGKTPWRMDAFYRHVRKRYGVLLDEQGKPLGGKWSHDAENRKPWKGSPEAPKPLRFDVDEITREVCDIIEQHFGTHPGELKPASIAATKQDIERLWRWVMTTCMTHFGPYEDAMSREERQLFHTRTSVLLNLHRLLPRRVLEEVSKLDVPLNSKEGFVRQVLGWREFMRHVHEQTDGLRRFPAPFEALDHGGTKHEPTSPSWLNARKPLPAAFWGEAPSGLACLDHAVTEVWEDAYSHHINRLMVLSNWATLLDVDPRAVADWFWVGFEDAFEWVVEPNVIGMGTFGLGPLMVTKPYISGSGYINKMSDYCSGCSFNPKTTCPMTPLYWQFLERHRGSLERNPRMRIVMAASKKRTEEKKARDRFTLNVVQENLGAGRPLTPESFTEDEATG